MVREQYIELKSLGFTTGIIAKHTGITKSKLGNMEFTDRAKFTYPEICAFDSYYRHAKTLARIYGDKLGEYLKQENS